MTYTHDAECTPFPSVQTGVIPPAGPGFVVWEGPEVRVESTFSETNFGGCCGLLVEMEVTNTDVVDHFYEVRLYHDTAFGTDTNTDGACDLGTIDGGPITVNGVEYLNEVELLPLGGDTCEGQIQHRSADTPAEVAARSPFFLRLNP